MNFFRNNCGFFILYILIFGIAGCGSSGIDGMLDDYEKLCNKSASLQTKLKTNDMSALKEIEGMAKDMQAISNKLEALKEKGFSNSQKERLIKIAGKCAGL
jgi:hypothetical protein